MKKSILIISFLFSVLSVAAQHEVMSFRSLTTEMGLSHGDVLFIYQDHLGYIWIGTVRGLNKYDGVESTIYSNNKKDTTSLPDNYINCMYEDVNYNLWVGTSSGLCKYNRDKNNFERINYRDHLNKKFEYTINVIFQDNEQKIWIGTNKGLYMLNQEKKKFEFMFEDFFGKEILIFYTALCQDLNRNIWISFKDTKEGGLIKYNPQTKQITLYNVQNSEFPLKENNISCLLIDKQNNLWVGYVSRGIDIYNQQTHKITHFEQDPFNINSLNNNNIFAILQNSDGKIFIGTNGGGLNVFDPTTRIFKHYTTSESEKSLLSNTIQNLFLAHDGAIWIACWAGGVNIFDKRFDKFTHFKHEKNDNNSLSGSSITSFTEDLNRNIWIASDGGGISFFDLSQKKFINFKHDPQNPKSLTNNKVLALETDAKANLWAGMWGGGLNCFRIDGNSLIMKKNYKFVDEADPNSNSVFNIYRNKQGELWVGNFQTGPYLYDQNTGKFQHIPLVDTAGKIMTFIIIRDILCDYQGAIWFATQGNGLLRYDRKKNINIQFAHNENDSLSVPGNSQNFVFEDSKNRLWIGFDEGGLSLFDRQNNSFITYTTSDGLPDNTIVGILEDNHGNLWISSINGISKIAIDSAQGKIKLKIKNFNIHDGLQGKVFNRWAFFKSQTGEMYFGGLNGFNVFHPDSIKDNSYKPPVLLTDFLLFNKPVIIGAKNSPLNKHISQTGELVLNHEQSLFTFRFIALNYVYSNKNSYAYKLEGFDKEWNFVGNKREATYTNIDPGEYTFRVKASNNDGIWNEQGTSVKIIILPPWWGTWWFRILATFIILASVVSFYLYRVNSLKRQKKILEEKVEIRTSQLMEVNSELEEQKEEILQQQEEILSQRDELEIKNSQLEKHQVEILEQKDEIEKAYNNIQIISEFGQKITASLDPKEINYLIYNYINSMMEINAFGIGIFTPQKKFIEFFNFIENGNLKPYFFKELSDEKSMAVKCFINSEEIIINDISEEYINYLNLANTFISPPSSVVYLPLMIEKKAIGTITVNSIKINAFTEKDILNLRALASYIAIAFDNANAYKLIQYKNDAINGSIRYGLTIQKAMLISQESLNKFFESFIIFKPKDVVSGDFYWFSFIPSFQKYYLAVVDCTGHGVPGAFMSMIGNRLLNEIVINKKILAPAKILDHLDHEIAIALKQDENDNNDGMDVALVMIENVQNETNPKYIIEFAGAKLPLFYYQKGSDEFKFLKANRNSIGGTKLRHEKTPYLQERTELEKGDIIYLFSDGIIDQCNVRRKKFGSKRLTELLKNINNLAIFDQREIIEKNLDEFMQGEEQRDDITFIGLKFK